jgi:predicted metal-dependent peptidase
MTTLAEARLKACKLWPYGSHAILSLVPVSKPGLGTMAVDVHWRLYYDLASLAEQSVEEAAGLILHEVSHLLLKHHKRVERMLGRDATPHEFHQWNVATDYTINDMLRQASVTIPDWMLDCRKDGFPGGLAAEEYYRLIAQQCGDSQPDPQQNNSDGNQPSNDAGQPGSRSTSSDEQYSGPQPQPGCGSGGSCADGQQREWELPAPSQCDTPGLKPHEADIIVRETAQRILEKQQGSGSGSWQRWAEDIIKPRVDPRLALLRMVRHAVEATSGHGDYSYRRNNRRDVLLPTAVQPIPRVTVIVDTSGSMDKRDLGLSLGLIGKVLNTFRIRDGIKVVCGDTQAVNATRVFDPKQVKLAGGGGTHMGKLIREVAEQKPKPQLIVVCSDGYTPWCERVSVPVVACLTNKAKADEVPDWIKTIVLSD